MTPADAPVCRFCGGRDLYAIGEAETRAHRACLFEANLPSPRIVAETHAYRVVVRYEHDEDCNDCRDSHVAERIVTVERPVQTAKDALGQEATYWSEIPDDWKAYRAALLEVYVRGPERMEEPRP